jgi:hypothetical protein
MSRVYSMLGEEVHVRLWWGKPEERRPFERHKRRLKDNIKLGVQEVEWRNGLD